MVRNQTETSALQILAPVAADMSDVEAVLAREIDDADPGLRPLLEDARLLRGKGLRPGLALLIARACGSVTPRHVLLAAAVEMIHNATLIHDDILDEATSRRNNLTVNVKHTNEIAVLLGDFLFARAFVLIGRVDDRETVEQMSEAVSSVCRGEMLQLLRRFDADLDEEEYIRIVADKTASLFEAGAALSARLAGASPEVVKAVGAFGRGLGIAFQIVDDCLDLVGDEDVVGKTLATDLETGKLTLPLLHFLETCDAETRREALDRLSSDGALSGKKEWVAARVRDSGALDHAYRRAASEVDLAVAGLKLLEPGPARDALATLADFVMRRQR